MGTRGTPSVPPLGLAVTRQTANEAPLDRRVVTAREAQDMLGIPAGTIRGWASQGRLFAVSIGERGERWYKLTDVLALRDSTRRRARHARPTRHVDRCTT